MYKLLKPLIERYKIYLHIDEYLEWKSKFAHVPRRQSLYKLVELSKKTSVEQITMDDLEAFKKHCHAFYRTDTMISSAMREVRCFLRYWKKRGKNCLRPDVVGDLKINYW